MKAIFSVDVEDWFHIIDVPSTPALASWAGLPSRVEKNFYKLLDIFTDAKVQTTCFFLSWVGKSFPHLVREAVARGHEVASHGHAHELVHKMTADRFYRDVVKSKMILEDIVGTAVNGYRAPGFSARADVPWFFLKLAEAGYKYDSSVFPAECEHGGWKRTEYAPYLVSTAAGDITEFPITVAAVFGRPVCFFGGGHLRLAPVALVGLMARQVQKEGRPLICYVHPREVDPDHPRLPMNARRRFKSYTNLHTTERKVRWLLSRFEFTSFQQFIAEADFAAAAPTVRVTSAS